MKNSCTNCNGTGRVKAIGADVENWETDFCLYCYGTGLGDGSDEVLNSPSGPERELTEMKPLSEGNSFSFVYHTEQ